MPPVLRASIKRLLTTALYFSGIAWLASAWLFRRRALVLMYHRVLPDRPAPDAYSADAIVVTPGTFERHMRFLQRFFTPVDGERLHAMLRGEVPWQPRACLVTFDDGWFDNFEHALPVLRREKVPSIVFVATGYVGTQETFWQERLTRLLFLSWQRGKDSQALFTELGQPGIPALDEDSARREVRYLVTALKRLSSAEIATLIERITAQLRAAGIEPGGNGDDRFMTWEQAAALQGSRVVTLGSHAHSHAPLTTIDPQEVRAELKRSNEELQRHAEIRPSFFAYPNGNYDDRVVTEVRNADYALAFTTDTGWVKRDDHPLKLKRINISERGTESNAGFLCRLLCWL
jgi:peptidoglycan/xylan/chitin deacetylase (PgdA/CDA1 family)